MISLLLVFAMAFPLVVFQGVNTAKADLAWYPYLTASPNPVGVGQRVLVIFGFTMPTLGVGFGYEGWTVTATDPDGNTQTQGPFTTDSTGCTYMLFTPDKVGVWKIKAHYPGGNATLLDSQIGAIEYSVLAAETKEFSLTVQEEQLSYASGAPLPTKYWEFPIYGENRAWSSIAGNWLMSGYDMLRDFEGWFQAFNPYTTVPKTGHILWTKPQLFGGIVGGDTDMTYYTGSSYRRELQPPVIIDGRMYYNVQEPPQYGFYCVDLATGKTIWFNNGTYPDGKGGVISGEVAGLTLGEVLTTGTPNWHGGRSFLWSAGQYPWGSAPETWAVWDAWSGNLLYTIANVKNPGYGQGGFYFEQKTGTLMEIFVDVYNDRLILWNSTLMFDKAISLNHFYSGGAIYDIDWNLGIVFNVTIPHFAIPFMSEGFTFDSKNPSMIIVNNQASGEISSGEPFIETAFSLEDGHILWNKTRNEGTWEVVDGGRGISEADDCYVNFRKETRQIYAYSAKTGEEKWVSEPRESQWGMYMEGVNFAYGKCYCIGYDGMIYAYDAKTGKELWTWGPVSSGLETPYGVYPFYGGSAIADHMIIVSNGEHSADSPLYRGERMYVVDADNGTTLWSIDGWYQQPCVAEGIVVAPNGYDGQIYCFGKGPSATTVNAPSVGVTTATPITISGTVMDVSAGASQSAVAKNFPNGLPCVSDESQSQWMSYVYQQQTLPLNATGVPVVINVVDSNGNHRTIGTTATDASGTFAFTWTPDIPGGFTIIANFEGSNSYYSSYAEAHFYASGAPVATPAPTPEPQSAADLYFVPAVIGLFVAIIIVGVVMVLMLRKRQ